MHTRSTYELQFLIATANRWRRQRQSKQQCRCRHPKKVESDSTVPAAPASSTRNNSKTGQQRFNSSSFGFRQQCAADVCSTTGHRTLRECHRPGGVRISLKPALYPNTKNSLKLRHADLGEPCSCCYCSSAVGKGQGMQHLWMPTVALQVSRRV